MSEEKIIPSDIICPITHVVMVDPVSICTGDVFERSAITEWLREHKTNPLTNEYLEDLSIHPSKPTLLKIQEYGLYKPPTLPMTKAVLNSKYKFQNGSSGVFLLFYEVDNELIDIAMLFVNNCVITMNSVIRLAGSERTYTLEFDPERQKYTDISEYTGADKILNKTAVAHVLLLSNQHGRVAKGLYQVVVAKILVLHKNVTIMQNMASWDHNTVFKRLAIPEIQHICALLEINLQQPQQNNPADG